METINYTYKLTTYNSILRLEDGASIPMDPANSDYQVYLDWIDEGNTPLPVDPPPPIVITSVTRLQARLALISVNLWDNVTTYFQTSGRTAVELAFWENAQTWRRDDPTLIAASLNLGLDAEALDTLFLQASVL